MIQTEVQRPKTSLSLKFSHTSAISFECRGLSFSYEKSGAALRDIDLKIQSGEFVAISGPSGSGKSTLLNLLGMIEPLQTGEIFLDGHAYSVMTEAEKNWIRRHKLGFIFQSYNLIDILNAEENVEYFLTSQGLSLQDRKVRAEDALKAVGLWEHRYKRPHQMSGGQRQRVAIARAVAKKPRVILADEPTASLDQQNGREVMEILNTLNKREQVSIVISSHDPMVLEQVPRIIRLRDGKIQRDT